MPLKEELKSQGDWLFRNRSHLPLIVLGLGFIVFLNKEYHEVEAPNTWLTEGYEILSLGISLIGLGIRIFTVGHTPKNTSGRNTKVGQVAEELNTTGIYSIVRHPLYLGNFFMWLGVAMLTENTWFMVSFALFYAIYYLRIMYAEESFLCEKFGEVYIDWARQVPAIIPSIKKYKKPRYPFNIKKVLKNEKNGFCAIFLIFWLFDELSRFIQKEPFELETRYWLFAAIAATIIYSVLKIMKKRKLLNELNQ